MCSEGTPFRRSRYHQENIDHQQLWLYQPGRQRTSPPTHGNLQHSTPLRMMHRMLHRVMHLVMHRISNRMMHHIPYSHENPDGLDGLGGLDGLDGLDGLVNLDDLEAPLPQALRYRLD